MGKYYAVKNGRNPGIYSDWDKCREQVNQYKGAQFKKFSTKEQAYDYTYGKVPTPSSEPISFIPTALPMDFGQRSTPRYNNSTPSYSRPYSGSSGSSSSSGSSGSYSQSQKTRSNTAPKERTTTNIYTDGSCLNNGRKGTKAGWAVYWDNNHKNNYSSKLNNGENTNNRAELSAIKHALTQVKDGSRDKDYVINTDSQYAIKCIQDYAPKWQQNGWKTAKNEPVKNRDLIQDILDLRKDNLGNGLNVKFNYVPGHAGNIGNEMADKMAVDASNKK